MISPLKPILTFFGVKDGKIEATALKRIADSLNNLINTYVAWADTVGQDYSISNFIKWLKNSQGEIVATELRMYALKAATLALNMVFAMFAGWVISAGMNAFINWMKNAKTHSEQLISTMEDAHDAAEEAQQDVDDIQQMFADHLKELAASARETGGAAGEYLAQGFEDAAAKIANNVMSIRECIDGIGSSLNYATDRIDHFQSGFSDISDIVTQYNTYGGLSINSPLDVKGLSVYQVYNNGYPTTYGNVLSIGGDGDGQILAGWSGSNNGIERLYYRNRCDMCST